MNADSIAALCVRLEGIETTLRLVARSANSEGETKLAASLLFLCDELVSFNDELAAMPTATPG
jgi:hypothetical protein